MSNIEPNVLKTIGSKAHSQVLKGTKHTHTFNADFSDIRPDLVGTFTVRRPSQLDRLQIGVTQSALLGGLKEVDVMTSNIAYISATLDVVIKDAPEWFDITDPDIDYEILEAIFVEYSNWNATFRRPDRAGGNGPDSTATGGEVPLVGNEGVEGTTD